MPTRETASPTRPEDDADGEWTGGPGRDLRSFWMLLTTLSGVEDEDECARLVAGALPSAVSCDLSGLALRDETGEWRIRLQYDGRTLDDGEDVLPGKHLDRLLETPSGVDRRELPVPDRLPVERLEGFPLRTLRGRYGALLAGRAAEAPFSSGERFRLERTAEQLALAVENLRLTRSLRAQSAELERLVEERTGELRHSRSRLRTVLRINNALVTHRDRAELFRALAAHLRGEIGLDRASLALYDPGEETATVWALQAGESVGGEEVLSPDHTFPLEESGLERLLREGEVARVRDLRDAEDPPATTRRLSAAGIRSYVGVSLRAHGEILGSLQVGSRDVGHFTDEDVEFLRHVADQVALAVENVLAFEELETTSERLRRENRYLRQEAREEAATDPMVGESDALGRVRRKVEQVAGTDATVLITGESGTGKELVARRIHRLSGRSDGPLVVVNCASVPRDLYESEFFGHAEGAFTGAVQEREGRFAAADGGTLFLDEVAEIPLDLQAKLLRVLQEEEYERVGEDRTRSADVRVLAATNTDLRRAVGEGRFRKDLFFRLNVFPIEVPPLRERKEDVAPLARHFLEEIADDLGRPAPELREEHLTRLRAYDWPGNVRELRNVIERAVITSPVGGPLRLDLEAGDAAAPAVGPDGALDAEGQILTESQIEELRRRNMKRALEEADGQIYGERGAAELLDVPPTTLASRLKSLGLRE